MDQKSIGDFLDGHLVNFRGAQWRPHFIFPQNYLKYLVKGMEDEHDRIINLDIDGVAWQPKLRKHKHQMKVFLDKAKRARYFDHIEFVEHMDSFYKEVRSFIEILWKLRLKKEI